MSEQPTRECLTCQGKGDVPDQINSSGFHGSEPRRICPTCDGTGRIAVATKVLLPQPAEPTQAERDYVDAVKRGSDKVSPPTPEPSKGKKIATIEEAEALLKLVKGEQPVEAKEPGEVCTVHGINCSIKHQYAPTPASTAKCHPDHCEVCRMVDVKLIGTALKGSERGEVLSSFNAG